MNSQERLQLPASKREVRDCRIDLRPACRYTVASLCFSGIALVFTESTTFDLIAQSAGRLPTIRPERVNVPHFAKQQCHKHMEKRSAKAMSSQSACQPNFVSSKLLHCHKVDWRHSSHEIQHHQEYGESYAKYVYSRDQHRMLFKRNSLAMNRRWSQDVVALQHIEYV